MIEKFSRHKKHYIIRYLKPENYDFHIIVDENKDKKRNLGNLLLRRAPEPVFL